MKYPEQESSTLEFKVALPKNEQIIKTIIGFCNQKGGKLIVGVADNGDIVGVPEAEAQRVMEYLEKSLYEATNPPLIPRVYAQTIGEKIVLIIEVSAGMNKPYYVRAEGLDKGVYVRLGRSTVRASADMVEELKWQSRGRFYDMFPVYHATMTDLDEEKIQLFLSSRKRGGRGTEPRMALLLSYHIVIEEHAHEYPTVAGILTCGVQVQKFFPEAFIICTHFAGVSGRTVLATKDCLGTIIEQFYEAYNFVISRLTTAFVIKGPRRKEELEIPEEALREMLINAIAHRNYHNKSPIKIAIFDDRIEIFSPGGFPGPITSQNLCAGLTYIRNPAIAKILRHAGIIETLGTGFRTLFESYEQYQLPVPEVIEGEEYIKCILPRRPVRYTRAVEEVSTDASVRKLLRLFASADEISMSDIVKYVGVSRSTAARFLNKLIKDGQLLRVGAGRSARYKKIS